MAAKQKQSQARRRGGSSRGSGPVWFLAGVVAGGLVTWTAIGRDQAAEKVRTMVGRTVGQPIGVDPDAPPPKPKFEFYTLLPEMEVVVPDEDLPAPRPAPAESDSTDANDTTDTESSTNAAVEKETRSDADKPLKPGHYVLQVASFRSVKDADGLKAKLILNGFNPVVQSVVISGEEKRYRVRLGPYTDRGSLEAARLQLRESGYDDPLVVRVSRG